MILGQPPVVHAAQDLRLPWQGTPMSRVPVFENICPAVGNLGKRRLGTVPSLGVVPLLGRFRARRSLPSATLPDAASHDLDKAWMPGTSHNPPIAANPGWRRESERVGCLGGDSRWFGRLILGSLTGSRWRFCPCGCQFPGRSSEGGVASALFPSWWLRHPVTGWQGAPAYPGSRHLPDEVL